ncbi:hypothetical protein RvY_02997-2 [Ramazzottius varieornatus]|uniref:HTH CENPB-type domain-containing protein n=1 Tax=Ramazzottius varieornatus TaxID=947166 RepID=A0A1D1UQ01_RAMVA|nr:hypothetical protein RvY_02997-2 [Ramazzottius varieornatus]
MMREYAVSKARELGLENFLGTQGWFDKWCRSHKVRFVTLHGEAGSVDLSAIDKWLHIDLPTILLNIDPANVYNCDETGVSWRELGNKTLLIGNEEVRGTKLVKDRFTSMLTCSGTGDMLPVKIVAFSEVPRSYRRNGWLEVNVEKHSFHYFHNKTAWVTKATFGPWLDWLNELTIKQGRHIILLADNFAAYQVGSRSNVKLVFLPPNTTSRLQPLDAGIIKSFKDYFKQNMAKATANAILQKKSANEFSKSIEIYDATLWCLEGAKSVKKSTILNCFRRCGIGGSSEIVDDPVDTVTGDELENTLTSDELEALESVDEMLRFDEDDHTVLV